MYKAAYVLVDLPAPGDDDEAPVSLAAQTAQGLLDPYLVLYEPSQVVNWELDSYGNLEWVVIRIQVADQEFLGDAQTLTYWYYFDRQRVALYQRVDKPNERSQDDSATASLAAGYPRPHAMTRLNRVPVRRVEVPAGLWLANRVYLQLLNHLNLENSLDFGLFQSNLAMLVIKGEYEEPVANSEVGYHHLPADGTMEYLEPAGTSFKISQERADQIEERIYKACYLQDQARTNRSTPTVQSGISKQMDKTPSRDALCGLGDLLRPNMQGVYQDVLELRGFGDITVDIRGLDFSDKATAEDMDLLEKSQVIEVNSQRYEREVAKKLVRLALPDVNPETLDAIDAEIDNNPTPSEVQAQQEEQQRADMLAKFSASFKGADQITQ